MYIKEFSVALCVKKKEFYNLLSRRIFYKSVNKPLVFDKLFGNFFQHFWIACKLFHWGKNEKQ